MKATSALITAAIALGCLTGGYYFGLNRGKAEMDLFCGSAMNGLSAALRSESLGVSVPILDASTVADEQVARSALVQYVRIQAKIIQDCADDPKCKSLSMKPLPAKAYLDHARSVN